MIIIVVAGYTWFDRNLEENLMRDARAQQRAAGKEPLPIDADGEADFDMEAPAVMLWRMAVSYSLREKFYVWPPIVIALCLTMGGLIHLVRLWIAPSAR